MRAPLQLRLLSFPSHPCLPVVFDLLNPPYVTSLRSSPRPRRHTRLGSIILPPKYHWLLTKGICLSLLFVPPTPTSSVSPSLETLLAVCLSRTYISVSPKTELPPPHLGRMYVRAFLHYPPAPCKPESRSHQKKKDQRNNLNNRSNSGK